MRLNRLILQRYKAFDALCTIEIRPLTILVGANNAGKSALARAIPLFAGGLRAAASANAEGPLPLSSYGLLHADTFESLIAGRAVHGSIELTAAFQTDVGALSLSIVVQNVVGPGQATRQVIMRWRLSRDDERAVELSRVRLDSDAYRVEILSPSGDLRQEAKIEWNGSLPVSIPLGEAGAKHGWIDDARTRLSGWAGGLRYLRSPRELVDSPFRTPDRPPSALGIAGREAPRILATSDRLQREVRDWFGRTFGVRLDVRQQGDTSLVEVAGLAARNAVSIAQAGQGLSQVLPVAVQCFTAKDAGPGVDILEHPEAELHPQAHAGVAELIVEYLQGPIRPVILETHSEVLLLRVRRKVAEGKLNPDDLAIYWINRDESLDSAVVRRVEVTRGGEVSNWPEGVFLEDYEEVIAIRREARRRGQQ